MNLREDAEKIWQSTIKNVQVDKVVKETLERAFEEGKFATGRIYMVAAGKAAWKMAQVTREVLQDRLEAGVVVTKYGHVQGEIAKTRCFEAGHPVPDANSFQGTCAAIDLVSHLEACDTVIFLLSGGGSALFEKPLVSGAELEDITNQLLSCGADIVEMNTIRKRLSAVKGGRFAKICFPAKVFTIVISDVLGDRPDMIASGPAYPDSSTCEEAIAIAGKYHLQLSDKTWELLKQETPKELTNVETHITGSVKELCREAAKSCQKLGYEPVILTDSLSCEARESGKFLGSIAKTWKDTPTSRAFIAGGETVVHLTGKGKGGRNQEIALAAAPEITGISNVAVFSFGSDGTDGPTDAAGGFCDGRTEEVLKKQGISVYDVLENNDTYHALERTEGLIKTGPTGTNVNDVSLVLIKAE